jgi:protein gp37
VRDLRDQCADADVWFLFKQWGEWFPGEIDNAADGTGWRADPDVDHDPNAADWQMGRVKYQDGMLRVGKKRAGRLLDGVTHDGMPANTTGGQHD